MSVQESINENEGSLSRTTVTTKAPKAIAAGHKPEGWSIELPHNLPDTLDDMITAFGADTVYSSAFAQIIVGFQAAVRRLAEAGKSDDEIASTMLTWKPGMRLGLGGDPIARTLANFGNLSPEQQADLLQKLASMQAVSGN